MANNVDIKLTLKAEKARLALERVEAGFKKVELSVKRSKIQTREFSSQLQNKTATAAAIAAQKIEQAALKTQILEQKLKKINESGQKASRGLNILNISLASFIGNITSRAVSAGVTSIVNGVRGLVNAGKDFETGLVSVGKTTGITSGALTTLGDEITKLSREIPVSTTSLLDLATVAGQLGIKSTEDIIQFTETLGKLTLATDIAGQEGAQSVARILTITGELKENGSDNIDKFGNVITKLGNDFAATESQILKIATRVSQGVGVFDVASEDILAISTALKATGSEAEASGTAIQKTFLLISEATKEGGEKLRLFSDAAGLTEEAFVELFKSDPTVLFSKLVKNIGEANKSGTDINATLKELGLTDVRLARSLLPLIDNHIELSSAISTARTEAKNRSALDIEAAAAANTLSGDLQSLSNAFDELGKTIFVVAGPAFRSIVQTTTELIQGFSDLENKRFLTNAAIGLGAAAAAAVVATGAFAALKFAAVAAWLTVLGPAALVAAALGAVAFVISDIVQDFQELNQAAEELNQVAAENQTKKTMDDIAEGFKNADEEGQNFLDSTLPGLEIALNGVEDPALRAKDALAELPAPLGDVGRVAGKAADDLNNAGKAILLFEKQKLASLKRFFTEEEVARLESKFAILKTVEDIEAFERTIATQGNSRRQQEILSIIGQDKATIESKRAALEELKRIAEEEKQLALDKRFILEQEALRTKENNEIFEDERLIALQEFFTAKEEVEIQAKINSAENERERQILIEKAQIEGQQRRLDNERKAADELAKVNKTANDIIEKDNRELFQAKQALRQSDINSLQATSSLITAIAGRESKAAFAITKAIAFAENIIRTQMEMAVIRATFAWNPPLAATLTANAKAQGVIRGATILATAVQGFEDGGIVGGSSFTGDRVAARVNSGEMILNRQQQNRLFQMANGQGGGSSGQQEIVVNTKIQLNEETIAEAVSRQVANGLVLGEVV